jgi:hypothetical protein
MIAIIIQHDLKVKKDNIGDEKRDFEEKCKKREVLVRMFKEAKDLS